MESQELPVTGADATEEDFLAAASANATARAAAAAFCFWGGKEGSGETPLSSISTVSFFDAVRVSNRTISDINPHRKMMAKKTSPMPMAVMSKPGLISIMIPCLLHGNIAMPANRMADRFTA